MAKKLISMKVETALLARIDARAAAKGMDRTGYLMTLAQDDLDQKVKPKPKKTGGQTTVITPVGPVRKRVPRQPGEVRVTDAPIASWGDNRPAPGSMLKQPKKEK
jgi:hypothetical protein